MQQPAYQPQTPARPPVAAAVPPTNAQPSSGGMDTADIATLNDALGSAGVDLRVNYFPDSMLQVQKNSQITFTDSHTFLG